MFDAFFLMPSKQKKQLLIAGGLLVLFLCYFLALEPTLAAFSLNKELNKNTLIDVNEKKINQVKAKLTQVEENLKSNENDPSQLRKRIVSQITTASAQLGIRIINIPEESIVQKEDYTLINNTIEVQGGFEKLNQLMHQLEREVSVAKVVSSKFETRLNRISKKNELVLTLYFQSIIFKKL
jgi:hypothetical protein